MFVKVVDNPAGGPDSGEAKWWKDWLSRKKKVHTENTEKIDVVRKQKLNLQIQEQETQVELAKLCARYDELVKQLAAEQRVQSKTEHRRLEVED